jgi:hypothetical protein
MSKKEPGFAERLQTAGKAKKTQLEKNRAGPGLRRTVRRGAGRTIGSGSSTKDAQGAPEVRRPRRSPRTDAQRAAEKARQAQAAIEQSTRKDAERVAQAEADAAHKNDQKAARDAKYAARKARHK